MTAPPKPDCFYQSKAVSCPYGIAVLRENLAAAFRDIPITVVGVADNFPPEYCFSCVQGVIEFDIYIYFASTQEHWIEFRRHAGTRCAFSSLVHEIGIRLGVDIPAFPSPLP